MLVLWPKVKGTVNVSYKSCLALVVSATFISMVRALPASQDTPFCKVSLDILFTILV
jgi:hypothetical protein